MGNVFSAQFQWRNDFVHSPVCLAPCISFGSLDFLNDGAKHGKNFVMLQLEILKPLDVDLVFDLVAEKTVFVTPNRSVFNVNEKLSR